MRCKGCMTKKMLVERRPGKEILRSIEVVENPKDIAALSSPLAWKILVALAERPTYPNELARKMRVHEQKVYYHVRRLLQSGLIEVVGEQKVKGAFSKILAPTADAFGLELPSKQVEVTKRAPAVSVPVREFFHELIRRGVFDGSIIVGAPETHGPYDTASKDGHYAAHLAMFLGALCTLPDSRFIVKLDTEVKAENAQKRNMILIGGPITNTVVSDLVERMEVQMRYKGERWGIRSKRTGKTYADRRDALVAKIKNPWDEKRVCIVLAGSSRESTKTAIIALTQKPEKILKDYERNKDFYRVIRGFDRDGDGKVDDVEVLE